VGNRSPNSGVGKEIPRANAIAAVLSIAQKKRRGHSSYAGECKEVKFLRIAEEW